MRVKYNVDTQLVFEIGDPLDHVTAPMVHNKMYELANINAISLDMVVKKGELRQFVQAAKFLNINGFDITMPHKTDIIPFLDECDEVSRAFKSVNHVKIVDGRLIGIGLDGVGQGLALEAMLGKGNLKGRKALIIGAGSVGGMVAADLCQRGVDTFVIVNRTEEKAHYIADTLEKIFPNIKVEVGKWTSQYLEEIAPSIDLAAQCTSLGMQTVENSPDFESLEFVKYFPENCIATDVLYPDSSFLRVVRNKGLRNISGKGMLMYQQLAMMQFRFGINLPDSVLPEIEETIDIAVAMREFRFRHLAEKK